ncbi:MAG TPA: hypothetical protein PKD79_00510 [Candidatus Doudnabacteria bacterium]|nr:hypothetical protein [Candidatus Doudnabacteria bacterium]
MKKIGQKILTEIEIIAALLIIVLIITIFVIKEIVDFAFFVLTAGLSKRYHRTTRSP